MSLIVLRVKINILSTYYDKIFSFVDQFLSWIFSEQKIQSLKYKVAKI